MSDPSFEPRLARLFAEAPSMADAAAFAQKVQGRLERGWRVRRWAIGVAGVVGGLVTAVQVLDANLIERAGVVSRTADGRVHDALDDLAGRGRMALSVVHALPVGGEVLWMVAGLAVVAAALVAARFADAW